MKRFAFFIMTALVLGAVPALAQYGPPPAAPAAAPPAAPAARIRGTVQALNGDVLTLQPATVNGVAATGPVNVSLGPTTPVAITKKANFADITTASFVGATTVVQNGQDVATEVHLFGAPPNLGSNPWDSRPQSTMTNAKVSDIGSASVSGVQNRTLTLTYPGGEKKVYVPPSAPIVTSAPGTRADLVKGEKAFVARATAAGGAYKAVSGVQVGKDGVDPPQ
jgi:hypothetical protein